MNRLFLLLFLALVLVRVPSVAEPAAGDQGLYAYVGQAIARGEVPYRDAWDQKPPAIHVAYSLMWTVWPDDGVVAAVDLVVTVLAALLLVAAGRRLTGEDGPGKVAALLFLLLGNPAFQRLSGIYVRAQCETFIALLAVAALWLVVRAFDDRDRPAPRLDHLLVAGGLLGVAFLFKYNSATFVGAALVTLVLLSSHARDRGGRTRLVAAGATTIAGFGIPVAVAGIYFALTGALDDLVQATIVYNVKYSGETYRGAWGFVRYLLAFPVQHARVDSLWLLGGAGCAVLLAAGVADRRRLIVPAWTAAACLSIAVNSGRGLPQYFVQALPLLALAAGMAGALAWKTLGWASRATLVVILAIAVVRVSPFDKAARNTQFDADYLLGRVTRNDYLARFATDRYSAAALSQLADTVRSATQASDRIFVFGFSGGLYVHAGRASASRFFWSRPILVGFNEGITGYGASGLLDDLCRTPPSIVVLQQQDWPAEGIDSATYFLKHPRLGPWLQQRYAPMVSNAVYQAWRRKPGDPGGCR